MRRIATCLAAFLLSLVLVTPAFADSSYTVQPGDTLTRIAARHGVTVEALIAANQLRDPNSLQVGQVITIPDGSPSPPTASTGTTTYIVQNGDSLARIAARFKVSVEALIAANNLSTTTLQVGQVLVIPAPVEIAPNSIYNRIQGNPAFVRRIIAALDWLQAHDPPAFERVNTYITVILPSPYAHLALAQPLPDGGCLVRGLARHGMAVEMVAALLYHEATHCFQFATLGLISSKDAEVQAYTEQIAFMERHGFPSEVIEYYRQVLDYYRSQPDDGHYVPPPNF